MSVLPETDGPRHWSISSAPYGLWRLWLLRTLAVGSKQNWIHHCLLILCWPSDTCLCVALGPVLLRWGKLPLTSLFGTGHGDFCFISGSSLLAAMRSLIKLLPCKLYWTTSACSTRPPFSRGGKQKLSLEILEQNCVSSCEGSLGCYKSKAYFMFVISVRWWWWGWRNPSGVVVVSCWC